MLIFDVEKCKSIYDNFTEKLLLQLEAWLNCDNFTVITVLQLL